MGELIGLLLVVGGVSCYNAFAYGVVLYNYYYWFVKYAFPEAPHLSFAMAVGLWMVISLFRSSPIAGGDTDNKEGLSGATLFVLPWFLLLIGWLIKYVLMGFIINVGG